MGKVVMRQCIYTLQFLTEDGKVMEMTPVCMFITLYPDASLVTD